MIEIFEYLQHFQRQVEIFKEHVNTGISSSHNTGFAECLRIDGLKGFPEAIQSVYPNTSVQLCIVHQIRNSIKYVGFKKQNEFLKDLKCAYQAVNKESA